MHLRYSLELLAVRLVRALFLAFPYAIASSFGGWLLRRFGPLTPRSKKARTHINFCFPDFESRQVDSVLSGMWENLGRTLAEFFHLERLDIKSLDQVLMMEGLEHLDAVAEHGCILAGAHLGNWEICALALALHGYNPAVVYREADNPKAERLIQQIRHRYLNDGLPKGRAGAKKMLQAVKNQRVVYLLVDQKLREGALLPFFNHPTKTSTVAARLALKLNCPILPTRVVRVHRHQLKLCIEPPLDTVGVARDETGAMEIMTRVNATLERWIREHPEQWLWLHHRWKKRLSG